MEWLAHWLTQQLLRRAMKRALKEANKAGKSYFSWQRSRTWRRWAKSQVQEAFDWAVVHTPEITLDDDMFRCLAWTLESDEMERRHNKMLAAEQKFSELIDVHSVGGMAKPPHSLGG